MEENNNLNIESENKTIKFKKKRTLLLAGIFILLIIITIFLLFFKNDLFKKEVIKNNNVKEEDKIDNEIVKNLLDNSLPYFLTYDINSKLYMDKLVKFNDLDQRGVLDIIIWEDDESLHLSDVDIPSLEELEGIVGEPAAGIIRSADFVIPLSKVKSIIKDKYNIDDYDINSYDEVEKGNNYSKFKYSAGDAFAYNNNIFIYLAKGTTTKEKYTASYTYEIAEKDLYVYEKMYIVQHSLPEGKTTCYSDQNNVLITATTDYEESDYKDLNIYEKEILDLCSPYAKTYKHVFKLNDSSEYYWYSTEPYEA